MAEKQTITITLEESLIDKLGETKRSRLQGSIMEQLAKLLGVDAAGLNVRIVPHQRVHVLLEGKLANITNPTPKELAATIIKALKPVLIDDLQKKGQITEQEGVHILLSPQPDQTIA